MHAILVTAGTEGDVLPYLRLGRRLMSRGHRVTLLANAPYAPLAARCGLEFRALISQEETEKRIASPDFWHPVRGPLLAAEWGTRFLAQQYALITELAEARDAVLVSAPIIAAARLVQEKLDRPLATLLLQPWGIPSTLAPPVMPFGFTLPRWAPRPVGALYWRFIDAAADRHLAPPLNRMRRSLDLPPLRRAKRWLSSPQLVLGMFPEWYGQPQEDWPAQIRLAGFPIDDRERRDGLPVALAAFCDRGSPPVVFTFGTGMMHAARQYRAAIEACRALGRRGVIITRYRRHLPDPLPDFMHHCDAAPFQDLFPRCDAVVHHGGIGTLASAVVSGTPQLILPHAHDQPDNAARVRRLGIGGRLGAGAGGRRIAGALAALSREDVRARCAVLAAQPRTCDGIDNAVDRVEALAASGRGAALTQ